MSQASRHKRFTLCMLLLIIIGWCLTGGQSSSAISVKPFDKYNNLCWDDEKARLDNFAIHLRKNPGVIGEVIVYAGRQSCPDEAKYRGERVRKWIQNRGLAGDRLSVRDGGYREEVETIMWMRTKDVAVPPLEPTLKKEETWIKKRCVDKVFAKVLCLNR